MVGHVMIVTYVNHVFGCRKDVQWVQSAQKWKTMWNLAVIIITVCVSDVDYFLCRNNRGESGHACKSIEKSYRSHKADKEQNEKQGIRWWIPKQPIWSAGVDSWFKHIFINAIGLQVKDLYKTFRRVCRCFARGDGEEREDLYRHGYQ